MSIETSTAVPTFLILTIYSNILTPSERTTLRSLREAKTPLATEQQNTLRDLEFKETNAISNTDVSVDLYNNTADQLASKIKDFFKKASNIVVLPIPLTNELTPTLSSANTASFAKYSSGLVTKSLGDDSITMNWRLPISGIVPNLFRLFYDIILAPAVSDRTKAIKLNYYSINGDVINNCLVTGTESSKENFSGNAYNFSLTGQIIKDLTFVSQPESIYEFLGNVTI